MEELHIHLNSSIRRLQDVHDSALEQSMLNSGAAIDFQQLLTKSS
jgi:phosphotransferase system IIA component